jgi:NTP pyrophosphatase (non-canonical NTP hydrolase)
MDKRFETMDKRFADARNHREEIEKSMIVIRETIGEMLQNMATKTDLENLRSEIKEDIRIGNIEIIDFLKENLGK